MYKTFGKRVVDITGSLIALSILAVPMVFVALAVKLTSKGSVLYKQERTGLNGKTFNIYKFRSLKPFMCFDGYQANNNAHIKTPIGNFLRVYSIDELPQIFNVLNGSMSLVGPRPHPIYLDQKYDSCTLVHQRYAVKPGITGLAQISGYRGETKTLEEFTGRILLDLDYINQLSFMNDIKIVCKTASRIFSTSKGS